MSDRRFSLRPARAADRDALAALFAEVDALHARLHPDFFRADYDRAATLADWLRAAAAEWHTLMVAEDHRGEVAGVMRVQIYETPQAPFMVRKRRAHLEELVVTPPSRRSGCGRALLDAARSWAAERGAEQLLLTLWAGNDEAQRFYETLGLRSISRTLGANL